MKKIIEKTVIEAKLAELERELVSLEQVFMDKVESEKVGIQLQNDAYQINRKLNNMISQIDAKELPHKDNGFKPSPASCFPIVATNM